MTSVYNIQLYDLLPDRLKYIDEVKWMCEAIQPQIDEILLIVRDKIVFTNLDKLDDLTLDYLLVECGIANSIETVFIHSREDKINFISNYVTLNKLRGTRAGIEYALGILGIQADITEWFEEPNELEPFWFKLKIISDKILSTDELRLLRAYIKEYKNTRSWYKTELEHIYHSSIYAGVFLKRRYTISSQVVYTSSIPVTSSKSVVDKKRVNLKGKFNVNK